MTASQDVQDSFDESLNLNVPTRPCVLKRQVSDRDTGRPALKRTCSGVGPTTRQNAAATEFRGFLTAGSNREVKVSEAALSSARARLTAADEGVSEEDEVPSTSVENPVPISFAGFVTAGTNKAIAVSESALEAAKRRLDAVVGEQLQGCTNSEADTENRDPSRTPANRAVTPNSTSSLPTLPQTRRSTRRQSDFISPLVRSSSRSTHSKAPGSSGTPVTSRPSSVRFNSTFRRPTVTGSPAAAKSPAAVDGAVMPSRPIATPGRTGIDAPSTVKVQLQPTKPCPRVTCVRDLNKCCLDTVDFLGIIIGTAKPGRNNVPVIKVADRHGESVALYLLSSSVPPNISAGSVISVEGAAMERNQGSISLVLNDSTFVDMEPNDPEAECLRRLFSTGLFDVAPTEGDFTFDNTALRVIGRLNEYSSEPSTVMARICSINYEALLYLGCSTCRRYAARNSDGLESCQNCRSKKARYFYSLNVEIADFSGVIPVHFSDEAAEKMIGKPAGAMVKVPKNVLRNRLSPLYYRPMLFRVSQQSSRWFIDDWKELEIARFKPFLKTVAEKKGYK